MSGTFYFTLSRTLLLVLLAAVLAWWCAAPTQSRLLAPPLSQYRCTIPGGAGHAPFRVYLPTDYLSSELGQRLCRSLPPERYGSVILSWQPREQIDTDTLLNRQFDLLWDRQRVLEGHLPAARELYPLLLPLPHYQVIWFSQSEHPALSAAFLQGKQIGLLADRRSQSGHQWPLKQLALHQLPTQRSQLHFYTNRQTMLEDFLKGRLDLIPGLRLYPGLSHWPESRVLAIATDLPIGDWVVSRDVPAALRCPLLAALRLYEPMIRQLAGDTRWSGASCPQIATPPGGNAT